MTIENNRNIVAIGGAAGASQALRTLLADLPRDLPAAVLVVLIAIGLLAPYRPRVAQHLGGRLHPGEQRQGRLGRGRDAGVVGHGDPAGDRREPRLVHRVRQDPGDAGGALVGAALEVVPVDRRLLILTPKYMVWTIW